MIVCGVLTDGRDDLLQHTLRSASLYLKGVDHLFIVDDSGRYAERKGLAGAVQTVWAHALGVDADYLFHLEDDWTFTRPVELAAMVDVLEENLGLAQMVLQRQALTPDELAAGGVAAHGHWKEQRNPASVWVEQTDLFSLNPCLIPRRVLEVGWPSGPLGVGNESGMTARLDGSTFAFWGSKRSVPAVQHIGTYRASGWTL